MKKKNENADDKVRCGAAGVGWTQFKLLLELKSQLEQRSWLEMVSRYFDLTGKRVNVEYFKGRLESLGF